ncbi:hypothetical protein TCSYLVIO_007534 [Trypanosoma cruzi]|uniref:Uncharacterized protein n=1 Tax=Trypanosoma cruzi TaxID=5693 RepID=A0A2V2UW86_TRYCR|nr:hypothetical protein TCSYLVIO_007534 [Trypanosoma cruzi]PBJ67852.1 hypothetical protein BCY84_22831 [Trypanosoma cruzi cruzi]PWU87108.1 hypothetical protein C4B63_101g13 [Trypanosoma cruzi]RNF15841.1 hypothetical protein TcG_06837 [Trypanosoma cruzi]
MLTPYQLELVEQAFHSLAPKGDDALPRIDEIFRVFDVSMHPRVKEGVMSPGAVLEMLAYQFGESEKEQNGVTFDVFMRFHERMAMEAANECVSDTEGFLTDTIRGVWRLHELLEPTFIRPVIPIEGFPSNIYATQLMSLVWPDESKPPRSYVLRVIHGVVQPLFSRGDLPPELRGFFAYPAELAGMKLIEVPAQISMQRWLDFVWEYAEGKYVAVPGIISARVDLETVPEYLRKLIIEPKVVKQLPSVQFVSTIKSLNPMYKRTSDGYGYGIPEEIKRVHRWKCETHDGTACGLIYHGRVGKFTKKLYGQAQSLAASGINL